MSCAAGTATVLFLHASGCTTDNVTDSDGVSHTAPIHEGYMKILTECGFSLSLPPQRKRLFLMSSTNCATVVWITTQSSQCPSTKVTLRLAGRDLAEHSTKFLTERWCSFSATAEREIFPDAFEKPSSFGLGCDTELKSISKIDKTKTFQLPDSNIISVATEHFYCVGVLLQPSFISKEANGTWSRTCSNGWASTSYNLRSSQAHALRFSVSCTTSRVAHLR